MEDLFPKDFLKNKVLIVGDPLETIGLLEFSLNFYKKKLIDLYGEGELDIIEFDFLKDDFKESLDSFNCSLFNRPKLIILRNFNNAKLSKKSKITDFYDLNHLNKDTYCLIHLNLDNLNKDLNIIESLECYSIFDGFLMLEDSRYYKSFLGILLNFMFKSYKENTELLDFLYEKYGVSISKLLRDIEAIKIYYDDLFLNNPSKEIFSSKFLPKNSDEVGFFICELFFSKKATSLFSHLKILYSLEEDPTNLIIAKLYKNLEILKLIKDKYSVTSVDLRSLKNTYYYDINYSFLHNYSNLWDNKTLDKLISKLYDLELLYSLNNYNSEYGYVLLSTLLAEYLINK